MKSSLIIRMLEWVIGIIVDIRMFLFECLRRVRIHCLGWTVVEIDLNILIKLGIQKVGGFQAILWEPEDPLQYTIKIGRSEILEWCRKNCKGKWENDSLFSIYTFARKSDAVLFKLTWVGT